MNDDWSAPTRASNDALRAQIDSMLDTFNAEKSTLLDTQSQAVALVSVWSEDGLVRASGTIAGVSEVHVAADAFKRTTPESLGRSITEAIAELKRQTTQTQQQALAPLSASMPDLSDLIPGAPSMKDLIAGLTPPPPPMPEPVVEAPNTLVDDTDDEEGDYFRNRSYLR
ncbi:YbaB/EbfC family DNA-binding protein [Nocardia salmonicida]|uniref:YbaB/EbfC family DNA-binding protein n=1 Tax=Nocardia salmonicida TaxID=53431 RepID=UPI002E2893EB|nr:YbaB/EbfC family DNA-binding protein [Nocardia salmonicida]